MTLEEQEEEQEQQEGGAPSLYTCLSRYRLGRHGIPGRFVSMGRDTTPRRLAEENWRPWHSWRDMIHMKASSVGHEWLQREGSIGRFVRLPSPIAVVVHLMTRALPDS